MTRLKTTIGVTALALAATALATPLLGGAGDSAGAARSTSHAPALFGAAPAGAARAAADLSRGAVERSRYVTFRGGLLPRTAHHQQVDLPFFDDAEFTATIEHVDHQRLFTSWSGPLDTQFGTFVATRTGNTYSVLANTLHGNYLMTRTNGGTYQVTQTKPVDRRADDEVSSPRQLAHDLAALPASLRTTPAAHPVSGGVLAPAADRGSSSGARGGDDGSVTDVLVAYTAQALAAYGGAAGILNEAAYNVAITNAAYANSGVKTTARLVGVVPVSGNEVGSANLIPDLNAFTRRGDGRFDEIFKYLKKTHADDSILLEAPYVEGTAFCGLAWQVHNQPAQRAFAVMATGRCTDGQPTFPHEFGHNQGAVHDYYTEHDGGLGSNGSKPQYPYGYGYVAPDCAFITIMSYQDECIQEQGIYVQPILNFSNPAVSYGGQTTGTVSRSNVAKLISKTRKRVARHQQSTLYVRGKVSIKPKPAVGTRVYASFHGWVNGGVHTKYQWYRDGAPIKRAKHRAYRVTRKDKGTALSVVVTGKKRTYTPVSVGSGARTVKGHGHRRVAVAAAPALAPVVLRSNVGSGWI